MMKKYIWPVLTGIICIIIFVFSAQNGGDSTAISDTFVNPLENIFSRDFLIVLVRKGAHISIYFALGICAYMSFKNVWWSVAFCFIYACSDEFHQLFVEGRSGSFIDVGIDSIGYILGILVSSLVINYKINKNRENTDEKHCKNNNNLI